MGWFNNAAAVARCVDMRQVLVKLMRGTAEQHARHPFEIRAGNLTLVLDAAELRYHDGDTPGGVVIPIPQAVHTSLLAEYGR